MKNTKSEQLYNSALQLIPGGVNSPVRAFRAVNMNPVFIKRGAGSKITDVDDNEYIDYVCSWGPLILGHSNPNVKIAIQQALENGTSYGAPCENEVILAKMIVEAIPSIESVRMVNSGTEATMSAVRLARAFTGREMIIKFEGCYHGHGDSFLIKAGSGLLTSGNITSPGVINDLAKHTAVAKYNDQSSVEQVFNEYGDKIAAIIVEPIAGNMGLVLPKPGFLEFLRKISSQYGALLIFDEVITGFRLNYGGYQNLVGIKPDLTTLGKIIGGGLPVGAYGGRRDIMETLAPCGEVYQAGTLSGNPIAMAAGIATLKQLQTKGFYSLLEKKTNSFIKVLINILVECEAKISINTIGSMFSLFFTEGEVNSYQDVITCDTAKYADIFRKLLRFGIYFPPSQFEVCFVSSAHSEEDLDFTQQMIRRALKSND